MAQKLPEVRIKMGSLLYRTISKELYEAHRDWYPGEYPDRESVQQRATTYHEAWEPVGQKILEAITRVFGLDFYQNTIDVYVAPCLQTMSNPLLVNLRYSPDEFINALTHEILHRLLNDNTKKIDLSAIQNSMFEGESLDTKNHILIHAGLKHIYLDVLKEPSRLERDIATCHKHKHDTYGRAWDIVEEQGYQDLINNFIKRYNQ